MSIDTALAELNTNILSLIAALKVTSEFQERLVAGQAAAIDKVEGAKTTRRSTKKDEAPVVDPVVAETPKVDAAPTRVVADADLRAAAAAYLKGDGSDPTPRKEFIASVMQELGTPMLCGDKSTLDDDGRKKADFYIRRKAEGLKVDFDAEYDFDGEVTQGDGEPDGDEDFGIG